MHNISARVRVRARMCVIDPIIFGLMIGAFLYCTGLLIVIIKKNAIFVMIGIELMLNGANVNLVVFSGSDPNIQGQLMGIFVVVLAAAESVVAFLLICPRVIC